MPIKKLLKRSAILTGLTPIMFDRYPGDNQTKLEPEQKLYLQDGKLVFPALNIMSFLSSRNVESATRRVFGKLAGNLEKAFLSSVSIDPLYILFLRKGEPVEFKGFGDGIHVERHVARMLKGKTPIPNPKERPVLDMPWSLEFDLSVYPNEELSEEIIERVFSQGGMQLGLGTYRGVYGKFQFAW